MHPNAWPFVAVLSTGVATSGCTETILDVDIQLLLPEDPTPLQAADNAHITLAPDGISESIVIEGPEFTFNAELDPDTVERTLTVYLARQQTLLGYGRTLPFQYAPAAAIDLRVLIAYPGLLTTFPQAFDFPDPASLAASFDGHHVLVLGSTGAALFLDGHSYTFEAAASWPSTTPLPEPSDGVLLSEGRAIVTRLAWAEALRALSFDLRENAWIERPVLGDAAIGRTAAAFVHDPTQRVAWLLGGGERTDVARLDLAQPTAIPVGLEPAWALDRPRRGATAILAGAEVVVVGGDDPDVPRVHLPARGLALGPVEDWRGLRCAPLDRDPVATPRILCAGGLRDGAPTADALLVELAATPAVTHLPDFLPVPMPDPRWFEDDAALYAQSGAAWTRVDRGSLERTDTAVPVGRAYGGATVDLATGVTMLIGGTREDGSPANRWQIFAPTL